MRRANRSLVTLALTALLFLIVVSPASAGRRNGTRYFGTTSQGKPISFRIKRDNHGDFRLKRYRVRVTMSCEDGSTAESGYTLISGDAGYLLDGRDLGWDFIGDHLHGHFKAMHASGDLTYLESRLDEDEHAMVCTTGPLTWTADRAIVSQ